MAVWGRLVRAGRSRLTLDRSTSNSREREPLTTRGDGGGGDGGGKNESMQSKWRSSNSSSSSSRTSGSSSSGSSRGYSMGGLRVTGAVMFGLVLAGLVGIFRYSRAPESGAGATMPAQGGVKATTMGNDARGANRF